jgi:mannitol/fructose-specific phosphotransferase system IIA component (Ntr-type)
VKLSDLLPAAQVLVPIGADEKYAVIDALLAVLPIQSADVRQRVRDAVLTREAELTTGIGGGVAIPHGQCDAIQGHLCAFGVAPAPLDFDAIDGRFCRIFFLCVSNPADVRVHVRVLSQMCRVLNSDSARTALADATSADDVRRVFLDDEARP